jgi:hypothetical protein
MKAFELAEHRQQKTTLLQSRRGWRVRRVDI